MKNIFKRKAAQILETSRVQTEWLDEYMSYQAQKNFWGRWDIYSCRYVPKAAWDDEKIRSKQNKNDKRAYMDEPVTIYCRGHEIEAYGHRDKTEWTNKSRPWVDQFFKEYEEAAKDTKFADARIQSMGGVWKPKGLKKGPLP